MVLKRLFVSIGIVVLAGLLSSFRPELDLSKRQLKRVEKAIAKTWAGEMLVKKELPIPDSLLIKHGIGSPLQVFQLKNNEILKGYLLIQKAKGCKQGGCNEGTCTQGECLPFRDEINYEEFIYSIIYSEDLEILNVSVIDYASEHGFEICNKSWLNQFQGGNGTEVQYGKSIDAISGATVSAQSITSSIRQSAYFMMDLCYLDQSK